MKNNTRKILLALIVALTMLVSMATVTAFAADGTTVYLEPTAEWDKDGARFAVYYWVDDNDNGWVDMESIGDGIYKAVIPAGYSNIIFVRMNGESSDNTWDNKWNQTIDLVVVPDDTFTISDPWAASSGGTWASGAEVGGGSNNEGEGGESSQPSADGATSFTVAGVAGLCGSEWAPGDVDNDMSYNEKTGLYEKTFTGIPAGVYQYKVAADHSWDRSWGDPINGVGQFGTDCEIVLEKEQNVTITFNPKTLEVGCILSESTGPSEGGNGGSGNTGNNTDEVIVYLENVSGWTDVYVYFWGGETTVDWPGVPMEYVDGDVYSYIVPAGSIGVIFNNGNGGEGNQTKDLNVPYEPNNYFVNDDLSGNWIKNPNAGDKPGTDKPGTDVPGTDKPGTDEPGTDEPGTDEPAKEMTWLRKLAMSILLWLRSMEAYFANLFAPKQ